MMERQEQTNRGGYNEVVVSSRFWHDHLPYIIQAFIPGFLAYGAHSDFLARYGYTERQVPMW